MSNQKSAKNLAKFLTYILGRRPDEFGLAPDDEGFVKIKDLIKSINEEDGWRHVRKSMIEELNLILPNPPFEVREGYIRAKSREQLVKSSLTETIPKLLFTCVTRKSYPFILEKGVLPTIHKLVILSSDKEMSIRIGKRKDSSPVLLTVNSTAVLNAGIELIRSGKILFLADFLPKDCYSGPLQSKKTAETKKKPVTAPPEKPKSPGSFTLKQEQDTGYRKPPKVKRGGQTSWKQNKKRIRREKRKEWPG